MALTSIDQIVAGALPPVFFHKAATPTLSVGRPHSLNYLAGIPGAASAPSPGVAGAALTSYAGALPFVNSPGGGKKNYLGRLSANATNPCTLLLVDRLWHNSGLSVTSTASQTVNSAAWPSRDANAATDGLGVLIGVEITSTVGSGTPTLTVGYTNSDGTSGKTGANTITTAASSAAGVFYPIGLAAGDKGVRSIQTYQQSATWTSGSLSLVAYRVLAAVDIAAAGGTIDPLTGGMPELFDNSVLTLLMIPSATGATYTMGMLSEVQA